MFDSFNLKEEQIRNFEIFLQELLNFKEIFLKKEEPKKQIQKLLKDGIISGKLFLKKLKKETASNKIVDVGSGLGFPGLVLALLDENNFSFLLIEPSPRKSEFLKHCINLLRIKTKVEVYEGPLSYIDEKIFVFKAFLPLKETLKQAKKYFPKEARSYHFKGSDYNEQIQSLSLKEKNLWKIRLFSSYNFDGRKKVILEARRNKSIF